jgi:hypothetical protein
VIKIKFRREPAPPIEPKLLRPEQVGAMRFTLRSVPRHHDPIRAIIDGHDGSRVYFSEPLAYLRGQGIALFRVEATDLNFLDDLYRWWAETERDEAFSFDINLFFNDREWVCSLREHTPEQVRAIIEDRSPRTTEAELNPMFLRDRA